MQDEAITVKGRYYRSHPPGKHLGYAKEELILELDETAFLVVDVYGLGYDEGTETEEQRRSSAFQRQKSVVVDHIAPALAAARRRGLKVLNTNYRKPFGELDIIALDADTVVFIEVKTTRKGAPVAPEEEFTEKKKRAFARASIAFVRSRNLQDNPLRLDFLGIEIDDKGKPEFRHVKNALNPGDVLPGLTI